MRLRRRVAALATVATIFALAPFATQVANATPGDPHRVTICHRTRSADHPYVRITVDSASVDGHTGNDHGQGDHNAEHQGPVATDTATAQAIKDAGGFWGDIIPPVYSDGTTAGYWDPLNWDTDGQTVFNNGCAVGGEGETGSLTLTKTIPAGIVEGDEMYIIHFVLTVSGGDPADPNDVVGECDFVFDAGSGNSQDCVISNLPFGSYDLWETDSGGFTPMDPNPMSITIPDPSGNPDVTVEVDNTFGPATAEACKVTDSAGTGYDASGDTFTFNLLEDGVQVASVPVAGGGTAEVPNCAAFDYVLLDDHTYTVTEDAVTGWTSDGGKGDCSFTPQFPDDADAVFTCTFTNTLTPAQAKVCKVTNVVNGAGFDPTKVTFTFRLSGSDSSSETQTASGGGTAASPKCATFSTVLQQGVTYTVTEDAVAGWTMGSGVGDCSFTVSYPGDSGRTFTCTFTNTKTFSAPLTPGYWKNHLNLDRRHPTAPYVAEFLPQCLGQTNPGTAPIGDCISGGKYRVDTTTKAYNVFNVMNCNNLTTNSNNAVGCLAGHLLAAKFNVANGADATCIANYMNQADTFLATQPSPTYNGPGSYALTSAKRSNAIALKTKLDTFNNGGGCV